MTDATHLDPDRPCRLRFQTRDADEYRCILSAHHAPARLETFGQQAFSLEGEAIISGGLCFSRMVCTGGLRLGFDSVFDGYGLSFSRSGFFETRSAPGTARRIADGDGLMLDSSTVTHAVLGADTNLLRISIGAHEMHHRLSALIDQPVPQRIRFAPDVKGASPVAGVATFLSQLIRDGTAGDAPLLKYPAALCSLREAVLHLILEAVPHSYSDRLSRQAALPSPGHVKRAMDFMSAHASMPLRLGDVAAAAGVSVRTLQMGFMQFRGISPMEYLRRIRLSGARAELLAGQQGTTVSHVAYRWGFARLASFSTLYARAFGERPSTTLRRATGP